MGLYSPNILSTKPKPGHICIDECHNLIQLKKIENGHIDPVASIENFLCYTDLRENYLSRSLYGAQLAVDIGVPTLARAAAIQGIPCFTIFDHSWSLTFKRILSEHQMSLSTSDNSSFIINNNFQRALKVLESDEASTNGVFLFPSPLTSPDYWKYWAMLCGDQQVFNIEGTLGGPLDKNDLKLFKRDARTILNLDQTDGTPVVLISAGGTPVWDQILVRLVKDYVGKEISGKLAYYVFIFASDKVREKIKEANIVLENMHNHPSKGRWVDIWPIAGCSKVHILGNTFGCTYQAIIAGVDLVVSRAGGATVNDSLACAVPMLLVPEPGHWQIETIHKAAIDGGYALSLPYNEFLKDPVYALDDKIVPLRAFWKNIKQRIIEFPRGREIFVVKEILRKVRF